ncbi:MAG: HEAT repeat domain-containing protein, partial [Burkholderiales bacterium]
LVDSLTHTISNLRKEAVIALGEIGDTRAIAPLEAALGDGDPDVRKLARLALTAIGLAQKARQPGGAA